jgi:hypothetical protein
VAPLPPAILLLLVGGFCIIASIVSLSEDPGFGIEPDREPAYLVMGVGAVFLLASGWMFWRLSRRPPGLKGL